MGRSQTRAQWRTSSAFIDEVRESERQALARELHDTVIQPLAALITSFECLQYQPLTAGVSEAYISAWKELAREAINSLRGTLAGLSEHPHAELGLPEALRRYLAPQLRSHGLRMTLDVGEWPEDLPLDITTSLYLAIREALTNVEKHARASEVSVVLRATTRTLIIIVADDGVGINAEDLALKPRAAGSGLGIDGMRARTHALGGKLTLSTAPGRGVRVEIRVPHRRRESALVH